MSGNGKYRRKSIALERKINFLIQSFTFDSEDLDKSETQIAEIDDLLHQLSRNNEFLEAAEPESINEHRAIQHQLADTLRSIKDRVQHARNRENLLSGGTRYHDGQVSIEMQQLLEARESVHKSQQMAHEFLDQTHTTKEAMRMNNDGLRRIRDKSTGIASTFGAVRGVMNTISRQQTKHQVILAVVIGTGVFFLLWWWWTS